VPSTGVEAVDVTPDGIGHGVLTGQEPQHGVQQIDYYLDEHSTLHHTEANAA